MQSTDIGTSWGRDSAALVLPLPDLPRLCMQLATTAAVSPALSPRIGYLYRRRIGNA